MNNKIIDNIYTQADILNSSCNGLYEEFSQYYIYHKDEDITTDELQLMRIIENQASALYMSIDLLKCGFKK